MRRGCSGRSYSCARVNRCPAQSVAEVLVDRSKWDMAEHNRMLAALDANG
jgi:hypothetical protein